MGHTPSHLGHVNIYVRNAEAARQWYEDVLGLHTYDFLAGRAAFMTANLDESHEIALMEVGADAEGPHQGQVGLNHMAWRMDTLDDLADFYNNLNDKGVEIKRERRLLQLAQDGHIDRESLAHVLVELLAEIDKAGEQVPLLCRRAGVPPQRPLVRKELVAALIEPRLSVVAKTDLGVHERVNLLAQRRNRAPTTAGRHQAKFTHERRKARTAAQRVSKEDAPAFGPADLPRDVGAAQARI